MIEDFGAIGLATAIGATPLLLLSLGAVCLFRRARASARSSILAATFAGLLMLPLALVLAPPAVVFETPFAEAPGHTEPAATGADPTGGGAAGVNSDPAGNDGHADGLGWGEFAQLAWAVGVLVILASLGAGLQRLGQIRRSATPWMTGRALVDSLAAESGVRRQVDVLLHEKVAAPFTAGLWSPAMVLPPDARSWPDADLRRALVHELGHVRRHDWAVQLTAWIVCALHWFNPLVWIARQRLLFEAERSCDDAVVMRSAGADYARQLVALAERMTKGVPQATLAMAKRSDLSARVSAILDSKQPRGPSGVATIVVTLSTVAVAVMSIASVRAQPASPDAEASARTSAWTASDAAEAQRLSNPIDRALFEAAEEGDFDSASRLLDAGANANAPIAGDGSPLIGAARRGRVEAVRLLLDRGADPNMPVRGDGNPLIIAAREGHLRVVALLLERGANVDQVVVGDENALIQASAEGRLPVVRLLVAHNADVNARVWAPRGAAGEWRTALSMARRGRHADVVSFLAAAGARD